MCGTICLDHSGSAILSRISQSVYDGCREGKIQLSGFPEFTPLLQALRSGCTPQRSKAYRVTAENAGRLVVLESFAKRWTENDATSERARHEILQHNENYNADGEYWFSDGTELSNLRLTLKRRLWVMLSSIRPPSCSLDHTHDNGRELICQ